MNPIPVNVQIKRLTPTAILPTYGTEAAAGADLYANVQQQVVIEPGGRATIPTGIAIALPAHLALLICPRSGLSHKAGITVHNGPGVIDGDYRGEIGVILHNTTHQQFVVHHGDRVAQGVIVPVFQAQWDEVEELDDTARGTGGFGSTGVGMTTVNINSGDAAKAERNLRDLMSATVQRQMRPGGVLYRNPVVDLAARAQDQDAADRRRVMSDILASRPAPGSSESHAKDAPALHTLEKLEPEEAAVALMRAA